MDKETSWNLEYPEHLVSRAFWMWADKDFKGSPPTALEVAEASTSYIANVQKTYVNRKDTFDLCNVFRNHLKITFEMGVVDAQWTLGWKVSVLTDGVEVAHGCGASTKEAYSQIKPTIDEFILAIDNNFDLESMYLKLNDKMMSFWKMPKLGGDCYKKESTLI